MFVAINRLRVKAGRGAEVEEAFSRSSGLEETPGFLGFEFQKRTWTMGPPPEEEEYLSVSRWESKEAFSAWTRSEAFRKAHGSRKSDALLGGNACGYEVVIERNPADTQTT